MVDATQHDQAVDEDEQPFLSHIIELRSRILRGVLIVVALFIPLWLRGRLRRLRSG